MEMELLIQSIVAAVLAHLGGKALGPYRPKILALITGGSIGVNEALTSLTRDLPAAGYTLVFTDAAARIHDRGRIESLLRPAETFGEGPETEPWRLLTGVTAVAVVTLSRNTAAKVARTIFDGLGAAVMLEALMRGIPVVAARDAADPFHPFWSGRGTPHPGLAAALDNNLKLLEQMGVNLVPAHLLGREAAVAVSAGSRPADVKGGVITAGDILPQARGATLNIACDSVVTPLARELAQERGIQLNMVER